MGSPTRIATRAEKKKGDKPSFFASIWQSITAFFRPLGQAVLHGDVFTYLSFLFSGIGYFFRGQEQEVLNEEVVHLDDGRYDVVKTKTRRYVNQWLRGLFYLAIEAAAVLVLVFLGIPNFARLGLGNLVEGEDNSFLIVLNSIITILVLVFWFFIHLSSIKGVYASQCLIEENKRIKGAKDDLHDLIDEHFYLTTLALPVLGILVFTLVPTVMMILIAFTNYGASGIDAERFTWVGGSNWGNLIGFGGDGFAEVFFKQFLWTIIWAVLATFTCFFGGLLLALLLNSKRTRLTKVWRTGFVITIAVPQFVSLMLIRFFLAKDGIVNNLLVYSWHLLDNPIPFLTDPFISKVTIIIVNCWVGFPYLMLMISGILMNIPGDLYESATIDGASKPRMFFSITLPYIMQVCTPYLISSLVSNINNFNVIYLLTMDTVDPDATYGKLSARQSDLLITWLYNMISSGSSPRYYLGSIIGIIMFAVSTVFTLIAFNISQRNAAKKGA